MSAIDICVRRWRPKSLIVALIAVSAAVLTAGLNPQNGWPLREFNTDRGRKPYPRKSKLTFGYLPLRFPSLQ